MRKTIILFLIAYAITISCNRKNDANKDYLIYQLDQFYSDRKNLLRDEYLYHYSLVENQPEEKNRYDSLNKVSHKISELLQKNVQGDRKKIIEIRDSIVAAEGLPIKFNKPDSIYRSIDDSTFAKRAQIDFLKIREQFHYFKIYRYHSKREL